MRIISGKYKGYRFKPYNGNNTRPTTDLAKEGLFNALENFMAIEGQNIIDIFAGTGNIGLEFLSRGAASLISVDMNAANIAYMREIKKHLSVEEWSIIKSDALKYIEKNITGPAVIFADPPYHFSGLHGMADMISGNTAFMNGGGIFILEHTDNIIINAPHCFMKKQYGNTCFSLFGLQ